jgi:hypothetical protein
MDSGVGAGLCIGDCLSLRGDLFDGAHERVCVERDSHETVTGDAIVMACWGGGLGRMWQDGGKLGAFERVLLLAHPQPHRHQWNARVCVCVCVFGGGGGGVDEQNERSMFRARGWVKVRTGSGSFWYCSTPSGGKQTRHTIGTSRTSSFPPPPHQLPFADKKGGAMHSHQTEEVEDAS